MLIVAILGICFGVCCLVGCYRMNEGERDRADRAEAKYERARDEITRLRRQLRNPRSQQPADVVPCICPGCKDEPTLTDTPIYLDALAWSEAARADWDEPGRWQQ